MQFQWFGPNPCGDKEESYTQASDTLHFEWTALWLKAVSTRAPSILLMPSTLQRKALEQIHEGHQGVEKCMLKARESVFWPGISDDIWETVEKCEICQSTSRASKPVGGSTPSMEYTGHWPILLNRLNFVMVGKNFTKYLIVRKLPNSSTHVVIKELGMIFTEFGWPFILRSDNGPCYSSKEFQQFLGFYQVHHTTSSPHHPQRNGFAEALVSILKKLMEKSIKDGKPWSYGLLQYWVTPISSTIPCPLEALTGRKLRTSLPQIPLTIGKSVESSRICQELIKHQHPSSTSTSSYSMELKPGQPVFIKEVHGNIWKTGTIDQPAKKLDSYWIRSPDDSILRKNHQMIKPRSLPSHFWVGDWEQREEHVRIQTLHQPRSFQTMLPGLEQPALQTGNPVTPGFHEEGTSTERQNIATSYSGVTQPSISVRRSAHSTKGVPSRRFSPSRT